MKNKFALFTLLGVFLLGTYIVFAQDNQDTIITEEVVAEDPKLLSFPEKPHP